MIKHFDEEPRINGIRVLSVEEALADIAKIPDPEIIEVVRYKHLEIEANIPDRYFSFEESISRIHKLGFQRHLQPKEYYGLLIDYYEGTLEESVKKVVEEILGITTEEGRPSTEWVDSLIVHNLNFETDGSHKSSILIHLGVSVRRAHNTVALAFETDPLVSQAKYPLGNFSPAVFKEFCPKKYEDLPAEMKPMGIYIPPLGELHSNYVQGIDLMASSLIIARSRGVSERGKSTG